MPFEWNIWSIFFTVAKWGKGVTENITEKQAGVKKGVKCQSLECLCPKKKEKFQPWAILSLW